MIDKIVQEGRTRPTTRADRALEMYVERFEEIALSFRAGAYRVPSCSGEATYTVRLVPEPYCSCPDAHGGECKHVMAVRVVRKTTSPCSGCGRRFRRRELVECADGGGPFANHDNLTWFDGDRLCGECADWAGVAR